MPNTPNAPHEIAICGLLQIAIVENKYQITLLADSLPLLAEFNGFVASNDEKA